MQTQWREEKRNIPHARPKCHDTNPKLWQRHKNCNYVFAPKIFANNVRATCRRLSKAPMPPLVPDTMNKLLTPTRQVGQKNRSRILTGRKVVKPINIVIFWKGSSSKCQFLISSLQISDTLTTRFLQLSSYNRDSKWDGITEMQRELQMHLVLFLMPGNSTSFYWNMPWLK